MSLSICHVFGTRCAVALVSSVFAALLTLSAARAEPVTDVTVQNATESSVEISWTAPAEPVAGYVIELTPTEPDVFVGVGFTNLTNDFDLGNTLLPGTLARLAIDDLGPQQLLGETESDGTPITWTLNSETPGGLTAIGTTAAGYGPTPAGDNFGFMGLAMDENDTLYGIIGTDGFNCFINSSCTEEDTAAYLVSIDTQTGVPTELGRIRTADGELYRNIGDLTYSADTGRLYTSTADPRCLACVLEIDLNGVIQRSYSSGFTNASGVAIASDGSLWVGSTFGPSGCLACSGNLENVDFTTGDVSVSENFRLENQIKFTAFGSTQTQRSALVEGFDLTPDGRLLGTASNANSAIYLRLEDGTSYLPNGEPDPDPEIQGSPVWRNLGDTGENVVGIVMTSVEPGGPNTISVSVPGDATAYTFENLDPQQRYEGRIYAVDGDGAEIATTSVLISAVTLMPNPTGLTGNEDNNILNLNWDAVNPFRLNQVDLVREYAIYASQTPFTSIEGLEAIATVPFGTNELEVRDHEAGIWFYAVASVNDVGSSIADVDTIELNLAGGIADTTPPAVTAPADVTIEATGVLSAVDLGSATAVDDLDGERDTTADNAGPFPVGTTEVTWSATDISGNTGTATQRVTVTDTTPPVLDVPANVEVFSAETAPVIVETGTATATDLTGNVTVTSNAPAGFPYGDSTITWRAEDQYGNVSTGDQTIRVTADAGGNACVPSSVNAAPDRYIESGGLSSVLLSIRFPGDGCSEPVECFPTGATVGSTPDDQRPVVIPDEFTFGSTSTEVFVNAVLNDDGSSRLYQIAVRCNTSPQTFLADVVIDPRGPNQNPVAVDDTLVVLRDSADNILNVVANDTDPDNDRLDVASFTAPSNGTLMLEEDGLLYTPASGFTGTDSFTYIAEDEFGASSAAATVQILVSLPAEANAGSDQTVGVGDLVTLDGSASVTLPDTETSYIWTVVSTPPGSAIGQTGIAGANTINPTFTADVLGEYVLSLRIFTIGFGITDPDTVVVTASSGNGAPQANAGDDISAVTGDTISLSGSASTDPDNDPLTASWIFVSVPAASELTDSALIADSENGVSFVADAPGSYVLQITVSDGALEDTDTVTVNVNAPPEPGIANAGVDQTVATGSSVALDGSASTGPDGVTLFYEWTVVSAPTGSNVNDGLIDDDQVSPVFVADIQGEYLFDLRVTANQIVSDPDRVVVTARKPNQPPVADAGMDSTAVTGDTVTVSSAASADPDSTSLMSLWEFVSIPVDSTLDSDSLISDDTDASFVPDVAGEYVLRVSVSDGQLDDTDTVLIVVTAPMQPSACPNSVFDDGKMYDANNVYTDNMCQPEGETCSSVYFYGLSTYSGAICESGQWMPDTDDGNGNGGGNSGNTVACPNGIFDDGKMYDTNNEYVDNMCAENGKICGSVYFYGLGRRASALCDSGSWVRNQNGGGNGSDNATDACPNGVFSNGRMYNSSNSLVANACVTEGTQCTNTYFYGPKTYSPSLCENGEWVQDIDDGGNGGGGDDAPVGCPNGVFNNGFMYDVDSNYTENQCATEAETCPGTYFYGLNSYETAQCRDGVWRADLPNGETESLASLGGILEDRINFPRLERRLVRRMLRIQRRQIRRDVRRGRLRPTEASSVLRMRVEQCFEPQTLRDIRSCFGSAYARSRARQNAVQR